MHDLLLPVLLFAALGGMAWSIRGSVGFGGSAGCIFAGVIWGTAWWFIAREPGGTQRRPYASGWVVLALTVGIGVAGGRGWRQWSTFYVGELQTNAATGEFVPISPVYGFVWVFIAGVPWAGLGACLLAWCRSGSRTRIWEWGLRLACGFGMAWIAARLFQQHREYFLPLYDSIASRYNDLTANPTLQRVINDNRNAVTHFGCYLGFLLFEVGRRAWKNVLLILVVGILSGVGWSVCQWFWMVMPNRLWPTAEPMWWRGWEASGGICIGAAYGLAYFLVNRRLSDKEATRSFVPTMPNLEWLGIFLGLLAAFVVFVREVTRGWFGGLIIAVIVAFAVARHLAYRRTNDSKRFAPEQRPTDDDPNLEWMGMWLGVLLGLGVSIKHGMDGLLRVHLAKFSGLQSFWNPASGKILIAAMLMGTAVLTIQALRRSLRRGDRREPFPNAARIVWLVIIVQNVIAVMVTGPFTSWRQVLYLIFYFLLFVISALIIWHYQFVKTWATMRGK